MDKQIDLYYLREVYRIIGFSDEEIDQNVEEYNNLVLGKFILIFADKGLLTKEDAENFKSFGELNDFIKTKITPKIIDEIIQYIQELNLSIFQIIGEEATEEQKIEVTKYLNLYVDEYKKALSK